MLNLLLAVLLCLVIHLGVTALTGLEFGVGLREIRLGIGPRLLKAGPLRVCLIPIAGSVVFLDADEHTLAWEVDGATGGKPLEYAALPVRLTIALSGCAALLLLAFGALGAGAGPAFASGFVQIVSGALPGPEGAALIAAALAYVRGHGFLEVAGMAAAKMAAFNLLPVTGTNGFYALCEILGFQRLGADWRRRIHTAFLLPMLALLIGWTIALVRYAAGP